MKRLCLWLLPLALGAGQARFARIGDFDGTVEVQLHAADDWQAARRNMPVGELSWLRTETGARLEVELDDGNVVRLGPDSLLELSDYSRLSTGQRITLLSLDHGIAYFTGAAEGADSTVLAVPGAQMTVRQNVRLRLEARDPWTFISAASGSARYLSPSAAFDLSEGQMVKLDPTHPARFFLYREVPPLDTDRWVDQRDSLLESSTSGAHAPGLHYGLADLDSAGVWIYNAGFGTVWKPKAATGWTPFRNGRWMWYEGLGYTWIADDPWGWLPYHYGRWMQQPDVGWFWVPGPSTIFKPGEVYWLEGARLAGWGPLAPGENWKLPDTPRLFLNANTTYASYKREAPLIDPAALPERPQGPPSTAAFALALPSPAFPAARLDAFRPALRSATAYPVDVAGTVVFEGQAEPPTPRPDAAPSVQNSAYPGGSTVQPSVTIVNPPPVEVPVEVDVPVPIPVYTGIIIVNPPGYKPPASKKPPNSVTPPSAPSKPVPPRAPKPKEPEKPVR